MKGFFEAAFLTIGFFGGLFGLDSIIRYVAMTKRIEDLECEVKYLKNKLEKNRGKNE